MTQLIIYACPIGALEQQLNTYFKEVRESYGPNAAHAYMPHCTLTGFFEDEESAAPQYARLLRTVLNEHREYIPTPPIQVKQLTFNPDWHGLELEADWLTQMVTDFAGRSHSPTRNEALRLKDWLHLSLAYGFEPDCAFGLRQLASELIDVSSEVAWELRFYERLPVMKSAPSQTIVWKCHGSWTL